MSGLTNLWAWIKKYGGIVGGALVFLLIFFQRKKIEDLSAKVEVSESDKKDAVLATQQANVEDQIKKTQEDADKLKQQQLSQELMTDYLKKL